MAAVVVGVKEVEAAFRVLAGWEIRSANELEGFGLESASAILRQVVGGPPAGNGWVRLLDVGDSN